MANFSIVQNFHEGPILGYLVPILDAVGRFTPDLISRAWQRLPAELLARMARYSREINPRLVRESDLITYFSGLTRVDYRVAIQMLESAGRHDSTPYLREVDVPALIIAGSEDRFTPPYMSEKMARLIPNSELSMVTGGTHSLPIEQPDLVELQIRRFLSEFIA
jgi:pimeloyl-ACP methyl ester carboxylesterase